MQTATPVWLPGIGWAALRRVVHETRGMRENYTETDAILLNGNKVNIETKINDTPPTVLQEVAVYFIIQGKIHMNTEYEVHGPQATAHSNQPMHTNQVGVMGNVTSRDHTSKRSCGSERVALNRMTGNPPVKVVAALYLICATVGLAQASRWRPEWFSVCETAGQLGGGEILWKTVSGMPRPWNSRKLYRLAEHTHMRRNVHEDHRWVGCSQSEAREIAIRVFVNINLPGNGMLEIDIQVQIGGGFQGIGNILEFQ
ncbi:hypothetical protein CYLTODRAFT_410201 [Cylindrobasidium torrendii FP15055 ss-10]|uniref:Uncharacterized protein n=1 Tax=Cylindrobasidium torrendii FP15055 ss-10 TaxID=1314674 RepID=A0A0D7BG77_9AGAR|nr:hypothetical protein CYLTODRAFT_410201 [Cylindrobasidium torrendii FP15055 ss-10]